MHKSKKPLTKLPLTTDERFAVVALLVAAQEAARGWKRHGLDKTDPEGWVWLCWAIKTTQETIRADDQARKKSTIPLVQEKRAAIFGARFAAQEMVQRWKRHGLDTADTLGGVLLKWAVRVAGDILLSGDKARSAADRKSGRIAAQSATLEKRQKAMSRAA